MLSGADVNKKNFVKIILINYFKQFDHFFKQFKNSLLKLSDATSFLKELCHTTNLN